MCMKQLYNKNGKIKLNQAIFVFKMIYELILYSYEVGLSELRLLCMFITPLN